MSSAQLPISRFILLIPIAILVFAGSLKILEFSRVLFEGAEALDVFVIGAGLIAAFEILLGFLLLSGLFARSVMILSASIFLAFIFVSFWNIANSISSCGCFGAVETTPYYTLTMSMSAFVSLLVVCLQRPSSPEITYGWSFSQTIVNACVLVIALLFIGHLNQKSVLHRSIALEYEARSISKVGKGFYIVLSVRNVSNQPVKVVGMQAACGYRYLSDVLRLPENGRSEIIIDSLSSHRGWLKAEFTLFLDYERGSDLAQQSFHVKWFSV